MCIYVYVYFGKLNNTHKYTLAAAPPIIPLLLITLITSVRVAGLGWGELPYFIDYLCDNQKYTFFNLYRYWNQQVTLHNIVQLRTGIEYLQLHYKVPTVIQVNLERYFNYNHYRKWTKY